MTREMNVVLGNASRRMPHHFSQRLQVDAVEDRLGSEPMTQSVELAIVRYSGFFSQSADSQRKVRPIPARSPKANEHEIGSARFADSREQPQYDGMQRHDSWTLDFLRLARLVLDDDEFGGVERYLVPFERRGFVRPAASEAEKVEKLPKPSGWRRPSLPSITGAGRTHESTKFVVGHWAACISWRRRDSGERVSFDKLLMDRPIERGLDGLVRGRFGPVGFPCWVREPIGQVQRLAVGDESVAILFRERLQVTTPFVGRSFGEPRHSSGEVHFDDRQDGLAAGLHPWRDAGEVLNLGEPPLRFVAIPFPRGENLASPVDLDDPSVALAPVPRTGSSGHNSVLIPYRLFPQVIGRHRIRTCDFHRVSATSHTQVAADSSLTFRGDSDFQGFRVVSVPDSVPGDSGTDVKATSV